MGNLVGRSLAHFRIEAELGEGGMGVVYRATDEKLRRQVALKVLPDSFAKDEDRRRRFLREARSAAAVMHSNIAAVFDVGEADGHVYIAMELVDGETLRARIDKGVSIPEGVRIAKDIARGLARAHDRGIVHRDLKPENVMITRHDEVKILDFGLAKLRDEPAATPSALEQQETETELTREGRLLGTPGYMSPEQARGKDVDARTDVFALGVVLHEMLTGVRPFVGETAQDVLIALVRDTPKRASEVNPQIPAELDRIIGRCLEKQADVRYANGQELLDALSAVLPEPGVSEPSGRRRGPSAPTVSLVTPPAASASKDVAPPKWFLTLVGVAALGVALLGAAAAVRSRSITAPAPSAVASTSSLSAAVVITEHPPPKTSSPEAAAAYAIAMQALRDCSLTIAKQNLIHAVSRDPNFAAAHLRLAAFGLDMTVGLATHEGTHEHLASAVQSRAALDARDQLLLTLLQAARRDPPDFDELAQRAHAVAERMPADAEAQFLAADALWDAGREAEANIALDRALVLEPAFALAEWLRASHHLDLGDLEAASASADRCLSIASAGSSCLAVSATIHSARGECDKLEVDARQMIAMEPSKPAAYQYLAASLMARGAPVEAVRQALHRAIALISDPEEARHEEPIYAVRSAVYVGDFASADATLVAEEARMADKPLETQHYVLQRLSVYIEEGDVVKAVAVADDYMKRLPAWIHNLPTHNRPRVLGVLHRARRMTDAEFRETREAWMKEARARLPSKGANDVWTYFYASAAENAAEAHDALEALPRFSPLSSYAASPWEEGQLGKVYALAGDTERAIPLLRAEAAACGIANGITALVDAVRDHLLLGQALEAKGDKPGACDAYGYILDRWKNAKPRSVTLEKAKERAKALSCPR